VFVLLESATEMYYAQKVRLGFFGARRGMNNAGTLAGAVVLRAAEKAAFTHEAMRARGYNGTTPYAPMPSLAKGDYAAPVLALAFTAAAFFVLEIGL
jgi:energy-coupling factor transporter transmembrane protein EcfT